VSGPPAQTEPPSRPSESGTVISEQELERFQHRTIRPFAQPSESSTTRPSEKLNSSAVRHLDRTPVQHIGGKVGIDRRGLKSESLTSRKVKRKYVLNKKNTKISPNKERAVAYARVSSKRQVEEGVSLEAQVERLIAYADFRGLDLDPDDIFIEEGVSAATHLWSRPAGREMREIIYQERVGHLLTLKMDRLFRDVQDCLSSVDELAGIGVDIHILDQNGGTLDTSNAMGRFFLTTIASLAELERGQISERTKFAMKHLKDNAKVFTGPIFGWDRDGEDLIPNWLEQDKIDYMRHRYYVQGWSGNRIAKHFNELGIKGKLGGSWTSSMILRTCRYTFHENKRMFKQPKWWGSEKYHSE
jgi:DNA invertase Pin-like site-specific DNA recombinase